MNTMLFLHLRKFFSFLITFSAARRCCPRFSVTLQLILRRTTTHLAKQVPDLWNNLPADIRQDCGDRFTQRTRYIFWAASV